MLEELMERKGLTGQPVKLDVGSGGLSDSPGFLAVDAFTDADISALMWDIPLQDASVDTIFCSNALEHVPKSRVVSTLKEFARLLKDDGRLQLVVPDLEWSCRWWLDHQDTGWSMDIIFGNQNHEGEFHLTGFTRQILFSYIDQAGDLECHKIYFVGKEPELQVKKDDRGNTILYNHVEQRNIVAEVSRMRRKLCTFLTTGQ